MKKWTLSGDFGAYPATPQISKGDFQSILDFYVAESTDGTAGSKAKRKHLKPFLLSPQKPLFIEGIKSPKTSLVAINEERTGTHYLRCKHPSTLCQGPK